MIIVTGGAGFIGSNLVKALNDQGETDILVVDDLTDGRKYNNLADCRIADYVDLDLFRTVIRKGEGFGKITGVFHQGACSDTTATDGKYVLDVNFECSKEVFRWCQARRVPLVYASSAAVYGTATEFAEFAGHERPLNLYGWSKWLFDGWLAERLKDVASPVVGLRYFNVYGPRESHKGSVASVAFHHYNQIREAGKVKLFEGCDGYGNGEQRRDFVYVGDAVAVNLWFLEHPDKSGIFNLGTGRSQPFNDIASSVIAHHGSGELEYIPFPEHLKGRYQSFTEADISALRDAGYTAPFKTVQEGVDEYMQWLQTRNGKPADKQ